MNNSTIICDFSGVFEEEGLEDVLGTAGGEVKRIDCRDIPGTNCYCDQDAEEEILRRIQEGDSNGKGLTINWIDTGDYHYMSYLTIGQMVGREPAPNLGCPVRPGMTMKGMTGKRFTVVLFDHHPDMQQPAFGDILSCGGWMRTLLERCPQVEEAIIIGINPELEEECHIGKAVKVYPEGGGSPDWSKLRGKNVYISIDKDVLTRDYARTDWDQGSMTLPELEDSIRAIAAYAKIAGMDICGGITTEKGGTAEDFAINLTTDCHLLHLLSQIIHSSSCGLP